MVKHDHTTPHAEILRALADGKEIQARMVGPRSDAWIALSTWSELAGHHLTRGLKGNFEFRVKPSTRVINGREVPAPETEALADGTYYYTIDIRGADLWARHRWSNDSCDMRWLARGIVFRTLEDALDNSKAMLNID